MYFVWDRGVIRVVADSPVLSFSFFFFTFFFLLSLLLIFGLSFVESPARYPFFYFIDYHCGYTHHPRAGEPRAIE